MKDLLLTNVITSWYKNCLLEEVAKPQNVNKYTCV